MDTIIIPLPNKRIEDLTGRQAGRLTIIGFTGIIKKGQNTVANWLAKCSCGNLVNVVSGQFNRGHHVSCGCKKVEQLQQTKVDLTGKVFGRLLVIDQTSHTTGNPIYWNCMCKCGNKIITLSNSLKQGLTTSCGCYHKEVASKVMTKALGNYRSQHGFNPDEPMSIKMQLMRASWKTIIAETKKRDKYACQLCGSTKNLQSHHIIPVSVDMLLGGEPTNIITLCETCHFKKAHVNTKNISKKYLNILQERIREIYSII